MSSSIDEDLDAMKGRAGVILEFCQKKRPSDLPKDDLDTKQNVLYLLQEDHIKFQGDAEKMVEDKAVADDDSTKKGRYRLALTTEQKRKDDIIRGNIALCIVKGYEPVGKSF